MTPRNEIDYCMPNDLLEEKIALMEKKRFDCMPILKGTSLIDGDFTTCLTRKNTRKKIKDGFTCCKDAAVAVKENRKMSETLPIRELIQDNPFQNRVSKFPVFLVDNNKKIAGLMTSADLDKVASRMYFYILFSELEHSLLRIIAENFDQFRESCTCRECIRKRSRRSNSSRRQSEEGLDEYHYLYLIEILHIIRESPSVSKAHDEIKMLLKEQKCDEISDFRNYIMHPKPIVSKKYPINKLANIQNLINQILAILKNEQ